jgi:hypothetical protein
VANDQLRAIGVFFKLKFAAVLIPLLGLAGSALFQLGSSLWLSLLSLKLALSCPILAYNAYVQEKFS